MKIIERPYYSQRQNLHNPLGSCFNTSMACMLSPFIPEELYSGKQLEDWLWEQLNGNLGLGFANQMVTEGQFWVKDYIQAKALNVIWEIEKNVANTIQNKVKLNWKENGDIIEVIDKINSNSPVLVQINNIAGGHIVCIIGYDNENNLIVNDSYGNALSGYSDYNGEKVKYPMDWIIPQLTGNSIRMMWYEVI